VFRKTAPKENLQEGDRVEMTVSSTSSAEVRDNWRGGERGTVFEGPFKGEFGMMVIVELDRCRGQMDRLIETYTHHCRRVGLLDQLAEL
jgi:hypothetical protein